MTKKNPNVVQIGCRMPQDVADKLAKVAAYLEKTRSAVVTEAVSAYVEAVSPKAEWTTEELQRDFVVLSFQAPFVVVVRKADNVKGSLEFTHSPRKYFNFHAY